MNTIAYIKILYRGIHPYFIVVGYIKIFLATYILIIRKDQVDDESQQRDSFFLCLDTMLKVEQCISVS